MTEPNQTTVENWVDQAKAVESGEAPSGSVSIKLTGENSVTSPGEPQGEPYQKQHAKVVRFEISVGADDDEHTIEFFEEGVRRALANAADDARNEFTFHNLTVMGGYYIIDGKVCLPQDYDPATKNRKPGTFPPMWAGGPDPKKQQLPESSTAENDDEDDKPREFVRVQPTIGRRDPVTGRRARKDKGVKRGPRNKKPVSDEAKAAIAKLTEQFQEAQT